MVQFGCGSDNTLGSRHEFIPTRSASFFGARFLNVPQRGKINQPRASPWGGWGNASTRRALKGRNRGTPCVRPFDSRPQDVALGWFVDAPLGRSTTAQRQKAHARVGLSSLARRVNVPDVSPALKPCREGS